MGVVCVRAWQSKRHPPPPAPCCSCGHTPPPPRRPPHVYCKPFRSLSTLQNCCNVLLLYTQDGLGGRACRERNGSKADQGRRGEAPPHAGVCAVKRHPMPGCVWAGWAGARARGMTYLVAMTGNRVVPVRHADSSSAGPAPWPPPPPPVLRCSNASVLGATCPPPLPPQLPTPPPPNVPPPVLPLPAATSRLDCAAATSVLLIAVPCPRSRARCPPSDSGCPAPCSSPSPSTTPSPATPPLLLQPRPPPLRCRRDLFRRSRVSPERLSTDAGPPWPVPAPVL
jgi:hypothetical protein